MLLTLGTKGINICLRAALKGIKEKLKGTLNGIRGALKGTLSNTCFKGDLKGEFRGNLKGGPLWRVGLTVLKSILSICSKGPRATIKAMLEMG